MKTIALDETKKLLADRTIFFAGEREHLDVKYDLFNKGFDAGQTLEVLKLNPEVVTLLDDLDYIRSRIEDACPKNYENHPLWKCAAMSLRRFGRMSTLA